MKISDNIMKDYKETVYTPYTYLIGWTELDKWYYGSRYATKHKCLYESGCHPDDLWETYHTSSDIVTAFREEHGEPDVREIRKTFSNADDVVDWEMKVLQRMNVVEDDKWLNGTIAFPPPPKYGEENPNYIHGRYKDPEYKREYRRKRYENNREKEQEKSRDRYQEKRKEYHRKYYEENREKKLEYARKRREENRENLQEYSRKYYEKNKEKVREKSRKYYEENRERRRETRRKWSEKNPEKVRESQRKYREKNREKILEKKRQSRAKKKLEKSCKTSK